MGFCFALSNVQFTIKWCWQLCIADALETSAQLQPVAQGKVKNHRYLTACGWERAGQLNTEDKCINLNPCFEVYWLIRMIYSRILTLINPTAPLLNTLKCFISPQCNSFLATKLICLPALRSVSRCVVKGTEYRNNSAYLPLFKCFHIATLPFQLHSPRLTASPVHVPLNAGRTRRYLAREHRWNSKAFRCQNISVIINLLMHRWSGWVIDLSLLPVVFMESSEDFSRVLFQYPIRVWK